MAADTIVSSGQRMNRTTEWAAKRRCSRGRLLSRCEVAAPAPNRDVTLTHAHFHFPPPTVAHAVRRLVSDNIPTTQLVEDLVVIREQSGHILREVRGSARTIRQLLQSVAVDVSADTHGIDGCLGLLELSQDVFPGAKAARAIRCGVLISAVGDDNDDATPLHIGDL